MNAYLSAMFLLLLPFAAFVVAVVVMLALRARRRERERVAREQITRTHQRLEAMAKEPLPLNVEEIERRWRKL